MVGDRRLVGGVTGVDDLDPAAGDVVRVPVGTQRHDLLVQASADLPGPGDDERLAGRAAGTTAALPRDGGGGPHQLGDGVAPCLPVLHEVVGQRLQPGGSAVDGVDHGHRLLDPCAFGVVQARGGLVRGAVDRGGVDVGREAHLDQSRLKVHRDGGAVGDRTGEVVHVDHVAEHGLGVPLPRDRRPGEGNERRVRQRVLEVPGVPVEVVVVAAVRLVDDEHDVAPLGQHGVPAARPLLLRGEAELLQRREVDAARGASSELGAQFAATRDLARLLGKQLRPGEGLEQLIVQVGAVGDDDDRGVLHRRVAGDRRRVQLHLHRLARALRVPDDARTSVATYRLRRRGDRLGDGEVLVRLRHPLVQAVLVGVEGDEAAQQLAETLGVEQPVEGDLQRRARLDLAEEAVVVHQVQRPVSLGPTVRPDEATVVVHVPRRVVVERCERRPVLGHDPVADHGEHAEAERHRQLAQVGAELCVGGGDVGVRGAGVLQLDDHHRHAVEVEDHVEASLDVAVHDPDLVDGEPLVLVLVRGDQPDGRRLLPAVVDVGDPVPVDEDVVDPLVLGDGVLRRGAKDLHKGLFEVLPRYLGIEAADGGAHPGGDRELGPRLSLRLLPQCRITRMADGGDRARRDLVPAQRLPAERLRQVVERELFPVGFVRSHASSVVVAIVVAIRRGCGPRHPSWPTGPPVAAGSPGNHPYQLDPEVTSGSSRRVHP